MKPPFLLFCAVLAACSANAVTAQAPTARSCRYNESTCYDGQLKPTGYCCPETYACGGPFPNVGCAAGDCCPTESGSGMDAQRRVKQRRAE